MCSNITLHRFSLYISPGNSYHWYGCIPANPQSTKPWRQPQKFSKWEPFLLADLFLDFTFFFNAITVHYLRNKWVRNVKRATVVSSQEIWCSNWETGRFHEKLGDSRENRESWQVCICIGHYTSKCAKPTSRSRRQDHWMVQSKSTARQF